MHPEASQLVRSLRLSPHPEGGFFRETYRDARDASTAIYYLLAGDDVSRLHRIKSDEVWHLYAGGPLVIAQLRADGTHTETLLGMNLDLSEVPQHVVPAGDWFGAYLPAGGYALVGCTVAPAFQFADLQFGEAASLKRTHPKALKIIERLSR
jgi:predicted cupin superfamily sugar epimerase